MYPKKVTRKPFRKWISLVLAAATVMLLFKSLNPPSPVEASGGYIRVTASENAYVMEVDADEPLGDGINVKAAAGDTRYSYLKFNVAGLSGKIITSVELQLTEGLGDEGDTKFEVRNISGTWSESTVTWNNKPTQGDTVYGNYVGGMLNDGEVIKISLNNFITQDGTYQVALIPTITPVSDSAFETRACQDASKRPQLVITYSDPICVTASEDAYVKESNPDSNFDNESCIDVLSLTDNRRYSFLKFNVTGMEGKTVTSVKLQLTEDDNSGEGDTQFEVRNIASGTWSESTVTWNNKPTEGSTVYGSYTGGTLSNQQLLEIPLNNFTITEDGTYQLALIATSTPTDDSAFESGECANSEYRPRLIIAYYETPLIAITASDDSYAREDNPNTNYNFDSCIDLLATTGYRRYSFLKFNVTGLEGKTITSVRLQLTEDATSGEGDTQFEVRNIASGTWTESAVTWNNKPTEGSTIYGSYTGGVLSDQQVLDITLDNFTMTGDGTYQFALIPTSTTSNDSAFESKECIYNEYKPKLIITYSEPLSMTVTATEDAYIKEANPETNYNNESAINLKEMTNDRRYSLLKFNVTGLDGKTVTSVKLQLTEDYSAGEGDTLFEVRNITSEWNETTVTWNNMPDIDDTSYGDYTEGMLSNGQVIEIALDDLIMIEDDIYQLALIPTSTPNGDSAFESRECGTEEYRPKLIITYTNQLGKLLFMDSRDIEDPVGKIQFVCNGLDIEDLPPSSEYDDVEYEPLVNVPQADGSWICYGMKWDPPEIPRGPRDTDDYIQYKSSTTDGYTYSNTVTQPWTENLGIGETFTQKTMAYDSDENQWLLLYTKHAEGLPVYSYESSDGLTFTQMEGSPGNLSGDAFHIMWDSKTGDYLLYQTVLPYCGEKKYPDNAPTNKRVTLIKQSSDGIDWTVIGLLDPDDNDPVDLEFYWFTPFPYADRYIGLMLLYEPCPPEVNSRVGNTGIPYTHGPYLCTEWMVSRDAIHWSRPYQDQYMGLEPGATGLYASGFTSVAQSNPIIADGKIVFPSRGVIDEDRIGCVASAPNGEFSSHLFTMPSKHLKLNATTKFLNDTVGTSGQNYQGYIMVELLDEDDEVIPGYEKEKCFFRNVDSMDLPLSWDGNDGTELAGQQVKLRFYIRSARVYAVTTQTP